MMLNLCRDGWRLNSNTSPPLRWRSTISPNCSPCETFLRSAYFKNLQWHTHSITMTTEHHNEIYIHLFVSPCCTKLAPGCTEGPLNTIFCNSLMLAFVTCVSMIHMASQWWLMYVPSQGKSTPWQLQRVYPPTNKTHLLSDHYITMVTSSIRRLGSGDITVRLE